MTDVAEHHRTGLQRVGLGMFTAAWLASNGHVLVLSDGHSWTRLPLELDAATHARLDAAAFFLPLVRGETGLEVRWRRGEPS